MSVLESERLLLRPLGEGDLEDLFALHSDPEVMRFIGGGKPRTRAETAEKLRNIAAHWHQHSFGIWALLDKADGLFAGWCGVGYFHGLPDAELGYALAPRCWGRGLATEAVLRVLRHSFDVLHLPRVVGVARGSNVASQRVLLKAGLTLRQPFRYDDQDALLFAVDNPRLP
jgi:ribosomal-protein-alanine N-acetyltransferase